jgi:hypothetical protein
MSTLKPFNLDDIDESLTRIVTHGADRYLMFPYINGLGEVPAFNSISKVIHGAAATVEDFLELTALAKKQGASGAWLISFSTPWLIRREDAEDLGNRRSGVRPNRH